MINVLIQNAEHEKIDIYTLTEATSKGSSKLAPVLKKSGLIVSVQTTGSMRSMGGLEMVRDIAGKTKSEIKVVYSPRYNLELKDLVVLSDGRIFEVQAIEKKGKGTILQHDRYFIVLYKNQNVLTPRPEPTPAPTPQPTEAPTEAPTEEEENG